MSSTVAWTIYGIPSAAALAACFGMCFHWRDDAHFPLRQIAVLLAAATAMIAIGGLFYVAWVGPIPSNNRIVESLGLLFSISGIVLGLKTLRPTRWYSVLALVVCGWLCVLFFLAASSF
jgi:TRAP-type C4-dicarboxylate transport system permease small subunit